MTIAVHVEQLLSQLAWQGQVRPYSRVGYLPRSPQGCNHPCQPKNMERPKTARPPPIILAMSLVTF
jgi:hypothetical protein